jgi:hypothetical protein
MIRRSTSAQFVPANAGAKAKNPVGSTLFHTPVHGCESVVEMVKLCGTDEEIPVLSIVLILAP